MLTYLRVANNITNGKNPLFMAAYEELCNSTNQYDINTVRAIAL